MFNNIFSKPMLRLSVVILVNENMLKVSPVLNNNNISCKHFARWSARKPSKTLLPEDLSSGSIDSKGFYESEYDDSKSDEKKYPQDEEKKNKSELMAEKKKRFSEALDYEVLEENDSTFSKLMTHVGSRKLRRKFDVMMLEGKRLNLDALQAGLKPKKLFFTRKSFLEELNLAPNLKVPLYKIPYKTMELWSRLEAPPGIVGFYGIPKEKDIVSEDTLPIKVLCDNVRDPGNLGSIIRVAAGVGCSKIILMKGCADPWDSKVLRSASGGHFHIPISMDLTWEEEELLQPNDNIFLADSHSVRTKDDILLQSYHDVDFSKIDSLVVIIGGETEGLSSEALKLASTRTGSRLYIPLSNHVESLNSGCALSVILFEIKRQFLVNNKVKTNKKDYSSDSDDELVSVKSNS